MSIIVIVLGTVIVLSVNAKLSFGWIRNVTLMSIIRY